MLPMIYFSICLGRAVANGPVSLMPAIIRVSETQPDFSKWSDPLVIVTAALTVATIAVVVATGFLARFTHNLSIWTAALATHTEHLAQYTDDLAKDARLAAKRQLGAEMWLRFIERFDSEAMATHRAAIASRLLRNGPTLIAPNRSDMILEFFEDLAVAFREDFVNRNLADSSFAYYLRHWWHASEAYVAELRKEKKVLPGAVWVS